MFLKIESLFLFDLIWYYFFLIVGIENIGNGFENINEIYIYVLE